MLTVKRSVCWNSKWTSGMFFPSLFFSPLFASFLGILFHVFNSPWISTLAGGREWAWGREGGRAKVNVGLCLLPASDFLQELSALCVCVLFSSSLDLTSFHASDSACDLKSKVLWCGLGLFGILSETLLSETRELGNMTNPIKTGQIVLGLKICGLKCVISPSMWLLQKVRI